MERSPVCRCFAGASSPGRTGQTPQQPQGRRSCGPPLSSWAPTPPAQSTTGEGRALGPWEDAQLPEWTKHDASSGQNGHQEAHPSPPAPAPSDLMTSSSTQASGGSGVRDSAFSWKVACTGVVSEEETGSAWSSLKGLWRWVGLLAEALPLVRSEAVERGPLTVSVRSPSGRTGSRQQPVRPCLGPPGPQRMPRLMREAAELLPGKPDWGGPVSGVEAPTQQDVGFMPQEQLRGGWHHHHRQPRELQGFGQIWDKSSRLEPPEDGDLEACRGDGPHAPFPP